MNKTMLTYKTLNRFEAENRVDNYTDKEIGIIEYAAYVANMNECSYPGWTDADIYADFLRVLSIHHRGNERGGVNVAKGKQLLANGWHQTRDGLYYYVEGGRVLYGKYNTYTPAVYYTNVKRYYWVDDMRRVY